jgi:hypothetical protein
MLVAGACSRHDGAIRTRRKIGFRIKHLSRFEGAEDAAPVGSTRFGPIHGWEVYVLRFRFGLMCDAVDHVSRALLSS